MVREVGGDTISSTKPAVTMVVAGDKEIDEETVEIVKSALSESIGRTKKIIEEIKK